MRIQMNDILQEALSRNKVPGVIAYNRIDGPGSSLDLREFQQALWTLPSIPEPKTTDPTLSWTRTLPRTVAITINTGTRIQALPFEPDRISVRSIEYSAEVIGKPGEIVPTKENWLLKVIELFGLVGVQFVLHNMQAGIKSAGLGGSATATTGACILANELAGRPFSTVQLLSLASRIEQDFGVSITGTQEQANVLFGGVTDYVWFPWGLPGCPESGYGQSIRSPLLPPESYEEIEQRMLIFHSGLTRSSTDVNSVWARALLTPDGYRLHRKKPEIAYRFREGLRLRKWDEALLAIRDYREVRTALCSDYMTGAAEIHGFAEARGCTAFPLGAGGGGGILVYGPDPDAVRVLREELRNVYREILYSVKEKGHELENLPLKEEKKIWT